MAPAWRDPAYISAHRVRQLEEYDATILERERERELRRIQALMPVDRERESLDFDGAVE